ncbi:MAG: formate dehydrogenase accessory sulfurtransferase FdhD, partial [Bryobacteraceae bacterium]|nr:formate dehydrogenase accessory sulfurtransferase FdhD [Bryobacteraceae bacterium]
AEGLISVEALPLVRQEEPNAVNVAGVDAGAVRRRSVMATSCGLCGKGSIEEIHRFFPPLPSEDGVLVSRAVLAGLTSGLEAAQSGFARTGGAHGAGLFDAGSGEMVVVREDVGRHNAVDKVIGHALLRRMLPLSRHVLLVSGRVSFEIVQKALGARIPVIASVSAPSSLAVEFAEASGQTLIGFLRPGRWNVYACPERIGP